jgi:hypothetical protein
LQAAYDQNRRDVFSATEGTPEPINLGKYAQSKVSVEFMIKG